MMKVFVMALTFCPLLSSCAIPNALAEENVETSISQEYLMAARSCIDAQVKIGSPILDSRTKQPVNKSINTMQVADVPGVDFYAVSLQPEKIYPDAPVASCRVEKRTGVVLSAAYQMGEPGLGSDEVIFVQHDPMNGLSEKELDVLINRQKIVEFPIALLFDEGGKFE